MLIQTGDDSWASESIKRIRERCKSDLLYLTAEILGEAGVDAGIYEKNLLKTPAPFHIEAARVVEAQVDALFLAPRIHLKTALITEGGAIQSVLRDPSWRNLLISETPTLVNKVLRGIVWHFRENDRLRAFFPEYRVDGPAEDGTKNTFDVPCRKGPIRDYSFEAIGVGGATAGGHYDSIRATDILSNRTVPPEVTVETMAKAWQFIRGMGSLLDRTKKRSHTIVEGTVWNGDDAYCQLRSDPGYRSWKKVIYGPWLKDDGGHIVKDPDGNKIPMWKEAYSREYLEKIRGELGEYLWSCNFEQDPMPAEDDRMFRPSWFRQYRWGERAVVEGVQHTPSVSCPCCGGTLSVAVTSDLAISQAKTADLTVHSVTGVCAQGALVLLDMAEGRWTPYESVERLYELDAIWNPLWIGIESVAWQKAMMYILHEEGKKAERYPLVVREFKPDNSPNGKLRRIGMLAAYAQSRGLWVRPGDHDAFVDECLRMTRHGSLTGHDDRMDSVAYRTMDMVRPSGPVLEAKRVGRPSPLTNGGALIDELERKGRLRLGGGGFWGA